MPLVIFTKKKLGLLCCFILFFGLSQLAFSSVKDFQVEMKDRFRNKARRRYVRFDYSLLNFKLILKLSCLTCIAIASGVTRSFKGGKGHNCTSNEKSLLHFSHLAT